MMSKSVIGMLVPWVGLLVKIHKELCFDVPCNALAFIVSCVTNSKLVKRNLIASSVKHGDQH